MSFLRLTCSKCRSVHVVEGISLEQVVLCPSCGTQLAGPSPDGERPSVPGYELLGELGRGGMGVVYKARHLRLDRLVALKMILAGSHAGDQEVARLRNEAEAIARLSHPNIVKVYEIGEYQGNPFLALELCPGGSLEKKLDCGPLPPEEASRLVETLARAVQSAHEQNLVHRDLKPANVLLGADGTPKITDFGLAKKLGEQGLTARGTIMGTPSYMAPEQAGGLSHEVGPAADVYALGAILYECLTGRPPFQAATAVDTLVQVVARDPVPPRLLQAEVHPDLETVCLKCLEKEPGQRYPSARALAEDLGRLQRGEPIRARPFNLLDRLTRSLERDPGTEELRHWGAMLMWFASILLVGGLAVFALVVGGPPYPSNWILLVRDGQFVLLAQVFWMFRRGRGWPASAAERQMASVWLAFLICCVLVGIVVRLQFAPGQRDELGYYPFWALASGTAFFVMGSTFWGRCYLFGLVFFVLAALMPLWPHGAPLALGVAWAGCLTAISRRLDRPRHAPPTQVRPPPAVTAEAPGPAASSGPPSPSKPAAP
jgi:serine/threonine-protein kinase